MLYSISDIIDKDIICAIYNDELLIKHKIEKIFPDYDFSQYNIIVENSLELIDEWALINEHMKHNQQFRDKIILMLDDYKHFGFFGDEEFKDKIFTLAAGYDEHIDELYEIGDLEINNCFHYANDILNKTADMEIRKYNKKQKQRYKSYKKRND